MGHVVGSPINHQIGFRHKSDAETGSSEPITSFYPSPYRSVVNAFAKYPIVKYFGISIDQAMALPIDQWYEIRDAAKLLEENKPETIEATLLTLVRELVAQRQGTPEV